MLKKSAADAGIEAELRGQNYTVNARNEILSGKNSPEPGPLRFRWLCIGFWHHCFYSVKSGSPARFIFHLHLLSIMLRPLFRSLLPGVCSLFMTFGAVSVACAQTTTTPAKPAPAPTTPAQATPEPAAPGQAPASLLPLPKASPHVVLQHSVGLSEVTIDYHAPSVRNRVIWEGLVPYNQIWRAGANENTVMTFSDTVRINGKKLPAGKYSFYIFARSHQDWDLVFNRVTTHWGAEGYDEKDDVLRVPVVPQASEFHETLLYWFSDVKTGSAHLNLTWEKKTVSFVIDSDVENKVAKAIEKAVAQRPGDWQLLAQAADYLVQNNLHPERALYFINESIRLRDVYTNNWIKARLLASNLDFDTAIVYGRKAIKLGDKDDRNFKAQLPSMRVSLIEWQGKAY